MIWLYRILFLPVLLVLLPYYAWRMWRRGGYRHDFHHRFGLIDRPPPKRPGMKRVWIQVVSVGEVQAIGPLLALLRARPNTEIVLTTTTSTGYTILRNKYAADVLKVGIFPLDFWPFSRNAWRRLEPDLAVLMEAELWPEHLHQAGLRNVPVAIINGRMSDRSFGRYQSARGIARRLLGQLQLILCATPTDEERFRTLGADPARLRLTGTLKVDAAAAVQKLSDAECVALREELGFATQPETPNSKPVTPLVLLGSSTWPGEEMLLIEVQQAAIAAGLDVRLLLVPRHAERRGEIMELLKSQPLPWHARSAGTRAPLPEQIMKIEVVTPGEYVDDIVGDLKRRRGEIQTIENKNGLFHINAFVPKEMMLNYSKEVRPLAKGQASYMMEPSHFKQQPDYMPPVKIYLGDTTGELARLTQAADVAFIGKSLPPHDGGQTPIEAAALGIPLVYGPRMSNFRDVCRSLEEAGAAWRAEDAIMAHMQLLGLLQNPTNRSAMAAAGRAWHAANLGATQRTAQAIEALLR